MSEVNTDQWLNWDRTHVWHPYTQMQLSPDAVGVSHAEGSYLYLSDGRRVLDAISSWWLTLHGHCHPRIAEAIASQAKTLEQVIFAGFTHEPASQLAKQLVDISPDGLEKVFYSDNGSTAVEVALKMCIQYWKHHGESRNIFLALEHAYHGDTFGAMSVSAESAFTRPFSDHLFAAKRLPFPAPSDDTSGMISDAESRFLSELRAACATNAIAGFIYEPLLLGAGGMLMWRREILHEALRIAKEYGVLTIADEVLTGFGRTGTMFASGKVELAPDLMTLSKGLTGGFLPMGVTLTSDIIFDAFLSDDRSRTFFHGHSYTANPISCAAALASLGIFREDLVWHRIKTAEKTHLELGAQLAERHSLRFRQLGTIAAIEPTMSGGYLGGNSLQFSARALAAGLVVRPLGDVIYLLPPYSTTPADLTFAYDVLDQLLTARI
jgi:adenosylmethionine-8-amino-7-oxononanoate aminotransferase